ncbi:MAG: hypothetical protein RL220_300 [Bacteroidota bacterium]
MAADRGKVKKYITLSLLIVGLPLSFLLLFGKAFTHNFETLPYFSAEHPTGSKEPVGFSIPSFTFRNQNGEEFHSDSLKGKVWLASFFSLGDPYLKDLTAQLKSVSWKYRDQPDVYIICFSTNPALDSTMDVQHYVNEKTMYHEYPGKWQFLLGDRDSIRTYIRDAFLIEDVTNSADLILVDDEGRLRGKYTARSELNVSAAMEDIAMLKKEADLKAYERKKGK